jgi:thiol-disulfide isomerase/thioredoxin
MKKARMATRVALGCLLAGASGGSLWAAAPPTVSQVLGFKPHQDGVLYTTPAASEEPSCKVELDKGPGGKGNGWILRDGQGRVLRRFFDSNADGFPDIWSFYKDGVETYRELDTNGNKKLDQFRWLNAGGTKWGIDTNEDGKIDSWRMIAPEEVGQEVLQAIANHDPARLQALLITEAEIQSLGLPADQAAKVRDQVKNAPARFQAALTKLAGLNSNTRWLHLEMNAPECQPAEQSGARGDVVSYPNGLILCETNGKSEWLQTGRLIQVGAGWRLVEGPAAGLPDATGPDGAIDVADKELQPLFEKLNKLDENPPKMSSPPTEPNREFVRYNMQRADILEQIIANLKPDKREPWLKQVADSLSSAVQASPPGDKTASERLNKLEEQLAKQMPGTNLAAYVAFREMTSDYAVKLGQTKDREIGKLQDEWLERLAKFVTAYPKSDDTPDALLQLGMVSEFVGKEDQAKKWYQQLAKDFADKPQAAKAAGAVKRLDLEGKVLELSGPKLDGGSLDVSTLRGKLVVVYYWASWNPQCLGDFAKLKLLLDANAGKVEVVGINLDTTEAEARTFLKTSSAPGTHLFQPGGLESPLATSFGVLGLPNLFLVGKDGKVISRTIQVNGLEDEIKKQLK